MTPTIAETAHAVLAGADRNDDAKKLARWVLERVAEEANKRVTFHAEDCAAHDCLLCDCAVPS